MNRLNEIISFLEYDYEKNIIIEPEIRHNFVKDRLFDVIKTYNPEVIVKAGLGSGKILSEIASSVDTYIVVVEPSMKLISTYLEEYKDEPWIEKIKFINGNFISFPVDYYAANLLISLDNLDLLESGPVIDEFRRAINFDMVLFIGAVVLNENDIDGVYDEFMRGANDLHNDFYLQDDLKTFMDLNELTFIKGFEHQFSRNLEEISSHLADYRKEGSEDPLKQLDEKGSEFSEFYSLNDKTIEEPYFTGVFMRRKPEGEFGKIK